MACKVTSCVGSSGDGIPAILVNFNSGPIEKEDAKNVECDLWSDARDNLKKTLLLKRKTQSYKGDISSPTESICNRLLLVVSKSSGEAKLVPFSSCQMSNVSCSKRPKTDTEAYDYAESRSRLAHAFGSKASKKAYEVSARIRATTAVSDGTKLEQTIIDKKLSFGELDDVQPSNSIVEKLLPRCSRESKNLADVYPLDGLLSELELEDLRPAAEMLFNQPPDEKNSDFLIQPFFTSIASNRTVLKIQLLLYANSLLTFSRFTKHDIKRKERLSLISPHSKLIETKILKNFCTFAENKRLKTQELTDKTVCHAIIAILLACNYSVHFEWLCSCLKGYRQKQLQTLVKLVGLVPGPSKKVLVLKLPLPSIPTGKTARK